MTLLDNELIRKYFACENLGCCPGEGNPWCMSAHILTAMQEPIRKGESALQYQGSSAGHWEILMVNGTEEDITGWHPNELRLPDRFQKCACQSMPPCGFCGAIPTYQPAPEPEICGCGLSGIWTECPVHKPSAAVDQYGIGFWSHGTLHELDVDLQCLYKALKPFLVREGK